MVQQVAVKKPSNRMEATVVGTCRDEVLQALVVFNDRVPQRHRSHLARIAQ